MPHSKLRQVRGGYNPRFRHRILRTSSHLSSPSIKDVVKDLSSSFFNQKQLAVLAASSSSSFQRQVYAVISCIPPGKVTTYKDLAATLSSHPRAVGQALKRNPLAPVVPCHRVVATTRVMRGFGGHTTGSKIDKKIALLRGEGVQFEDLDSVTDNTKARVAKSSLFATKDLSEAVISEFDKIQPPVLSVEM